MQITDKYYDGERPLYESRDLRLERVTIGEGESGLKESRHIVALDCCFEGMYVIWECEDVECKNCTFEKDSRASLWYVRGLRMDNCRIRSVKPLREIKELTINYLRINRGAESFWFCRNGEINHLQITKGEYAFFHSENLQINRLYLQGKYTFQYTKGIEIHDAVLDTKDAFWNSEDCTIYDSEIRGEYLGWYAKNLRLVRCRISGTQPLCYCENLVIEECSFAPDADRAFEKSFVKATIIGEITSVVNPIPGSEIANAKLETP